MSVKLPGAKEPIARTFAIDERLDSRGGGTGVVTSRKPWGVLTVEASPGPDGKLILRRLKVDVWEEWGSVRGECLGFSTVKTDFLQPRRLNGMTLSTASGQVPLFFDESAGLDRAEITVTGALEIPAAVAPNASAEPGRPALVTPWLDSDDWVVKGEEVYQQDESHNGHVLLLGDPNWADYDFEAEGQPIAGDFSEFGLVFRATGREDCMNACIESFGNTRHAVIGLQKGRGPFAVGQTPGTIDKSRWYRVRIEVRGGGYKMFLDGRRVLSGHRDDYPRGCVGLVTVGASARFRRLQVTDPDGKILLEGVPAALPRAKDVAYRDVGAALQEAARQRPHDPEARFALGAFHAQWGEWKPACAEFDRGLALNPKDYGAWGHYGVWYRVAVLRLQLGDKEGWRAACREMLERFGSTPDPEIAFRTARACLLVPDSVASTETIVRLADRALAGPENHPNYRDFRLTKCLAEYRAGRYDRAVAGLQDLSPASGGGSLDAACFAALAMAEHRRGRAAEARAAIGKCRVILTEKSPDPAGGRPFPGDWYNWLPTLIIYREAEEVIGHAPGAGQQNQGKKPDYVAP